MYTCIYILYASRQAAPASRFLVFNMYIRTDIHIYCIPWVKSTPGDLTPAPPLILSFACRPPPAATFFPAAPRPAAPRPAAPAAPRPAAALPRPRAGALALDAGLGACQKEKDKGDYG